MFTYSFSDGDGDVLHGVTGVRVECPVYVNIAHHSQLRVGLDVVVDVYLNCRDNWIFCQHSKFQN